MKKIYFNWYELYQKGRANPAAIILLTCGLTKKYDYNTSTYIMKLLHLNHIPTFLFKDGLLSTHNNLIKFNYKTEESQCYFYNDMFLRTRVSAREKVIYLKALSFRSITDKKASIPLKYLGNLDISKNPFLTLKEDKVIFSFELHQNILHTRTNVQSKGVQNDFMG